MLVKTFKTTLAIILAVTLCFPLSACQSNKTDSSKTTAEGYRWENFDDGSDVLDLDVPYIPANVDNFSCNIILEQGKFANELSSNQITLAGAIENWQVQSLTRKDDVTATLSLKKPDGWLENGSAIAQVELAADAVEDETSVDLVAKKAQIEEENKALEEEGVDVSKVIEEATEDKSDWPTDDDAVEVLDKEITLGDVVEITDLSDEELAQVEVVKRTEPYVVDAVFADPYLDLQENDVNLKDNSLTLKMKAVDFVLNGNVDKTNFKVEGADVSVESAKLATSSELEVVLNLPNSDVDVLDGAYLVLASDANETQSEVKGALRIPDPYLAVEQDYSDDEKVVLNATLNNTNDKLSANDLKVSVDGEQVEGAKITQNSDGAFSVSVPTSSMAEDATIEIQVEEINDFAGQAVKGVAACAVVEEAGSRLAGTIGFEVAKFILGELAKWGWKSFINAFSDDETGEPTVSTNELMEKLNSVEEQLKDTNTRVDSLYDSLQSNHYEDIVNNSRSLISKINNQELQLKGKMKKINAAQGEANKKAAIKALYDNPRDGALVDELARNLGVFYDSIVKASAISGKDLIQVYDDMCATSFNWGSQAYSQRQAFRNEIAAVWVVGLAQIDTIYGVAVPDEQAELLDRLDTMNKNVNVLINETHQIDESCAKKNKDKKDAYYNYTTGKWLTVTNGTESGNSWLINATPFTKYELKYRIKGGYFFPSIIDEDSLHFSSSGTSFASTSEVKAMVERLQDGKSLKTELEEIGFKTVKYLITSEKLVLDDRRQQRIIIKFFNWQMDTFEVSNATRKNASFTSNKKHFSALGRGEKYRFAEWATKPSEMFVLSYVKFK